MLFYFLRSKNKRPDAAVYVPRARRSKETTTADTPDSEMKDVIAVPTEREAKSKSRRNKAGMEVYVPRPKRLQQDSEKESCSDEKSISIEESVDSAKGIESEETKKPKKHKVKGKEASGGLKDKKKDVPKHEKHKRSKCENGEKSDTKESVQERCLEEEENFTSMEPLNATPTGNDTWENEMKFYDDSNNAELEMNVDGNLKEMCLDRPSSAANDIYVSETSDHCFVQTVSEKSTKETNSEESMSTMEMDSTLIDVSGQHCVHLAEHDSNFSEGGAMESDLNLKPSTSNHQESECGQAVSVAADELKEQPSKRRKSSEEEGQTETKVNYSTKNEFDDHLENFENELEVDKLEQSGLTEPEPEKTMPVETPINNSVESVNSTNDDNTEAGVKAEHGNTISDSKDKTSENGPDNKTVKLNAAEDEEEGDTWDTLFDDDGEALDPKLVEEVI